MIKDCPRCGSARYIGKDGETRCRRCAMERTAEWRKKHPDRHRELNRIWYRRNAELARKRNRARYEEMRNNPELWVAYLERKRKERSLSACDRKRQRRRREWLRSGTVTKLQLVELHIKSNGACHYCKKPVKPRFNQTDPRGFDHIVPMPKGGKHEITNMVVCCKPCNTRKGLKSL